MDFQEHVSSSQVPGWLSPSTGDGKRGEEATEVQARKQGGGAVDGKVASREQV